MNAFLATTALDTFWDKTKPILFLAGWCHAGVAPVSVDAIGTLPSPWREPDAIARGSQTIRETFEWALPPLANALNNANGTRYSVRYWRITIGPWLLWYVTALYDRYRRLADAGTFETWLLARESFVVPNDSLEFAQYTKDDPYNLQLITRILEALGRDHPRHPYAFAAAPFPQTPKGSVLADIARIQERFAPVVLKHAYLPDRRAELAVMLKSCGRVAINRSSETPDLSTIPVDHQKRESMRFADGDPFRAIVGQSAPLDLPKCHLEGFSAIREAAKRNHPARPRAIVSGIGWFHDEPFKHWAAEQAERGALLAGMQHGGNYSAFRDMLWQEHELRITDRYYSWGWTANDEPKVKPLPATKLAYHRPAPANPGGDVLYTTTTFLRFPLLLVDSDVHTLPYIERQLRFLRAAAPRFGAMLRVRPHREDLGWDYVKRWRAEFPALLIEDWSTPFPRSLERCRIYVADHLETTYIEALALNKPTILFYDPQHRRLREEAKPYYDELISAGILHTDPESAAATLARVFDQTEAWWNDPARQQARTRFCERFAWTAPDAAAQWAREFRALAR